MPPSYTGQYKLQFQSPVSPPIQTRCFHKSTCCLSVGKYYGCIKSIESLPTKTMWPNTVDHLTNTQDEQRGELHQLFMNKLVG
ncbi:hypothetical protein FKM82_026915 [Ascaphus truei]